MAQIDVAVALRLAEPLRSLPPSLKGFVRILTGLLVIVGLSDEVLLALLLARNL